MNMLLKDVIRFTVEAIHMVAEISAECLLTGNRT